MKQTADDYRFNNFKQYVIRIFHTWRSRQSHSVYLRFCFFQLRLQVKMLFLDVSCFFLQGYSLGGRGEHNILVEGIKHWGDKFSIWFRSHFLSHWKTSEIYSFHVTLHDRFLDVAGLCRGKALGVKILKVKCMSAPFNFSHHRDALFSCRCSTNLWVFACIFFFGDLCR